MSGTVDIMSSVPDIKSEMGLFPPMVSKSRVGGRGDAGSLLRSGAVSTERVGFESNTFGGVGTR